MTNVRGAIETRRWLLSDLSHLRFLKQCCPSDTVSEIFEARNKDFRICMRLRAQHLKGVRVGTFTI